MLKGPAMSREEAVRSIETGIELIEEELGEGLDIIGTGDMGIGNTTPSSAILAVMGKMDVDVATGRGTGLDDEMLQRKISVIKKAIDLNQPTPNDPIDVPAKGGGEEIRRIWGVFLGGAPSRIPGIL